MAYESKITYEVDDLNSSIFLEMIREILQVEFLNQRTEHSKTFLPQLVKKDEYLLSPVVDKEIDPAFCSVIKASMQNTDSRYFNQNNDTNQYIIGILANGLENLRKIADAVFMILNDLDIKNYLFTFKDANGTQLISDSAEYYIQNLSTEYEVTKTMNNREIVYGSLVLNAQIAEVPLQNEYPDLEGIDSKITIHDQDVKQSSDLTP
jgi:hypothetical protein